MKTVHQYIVRTTLRLALASVIACISVVPAVVQAEVNPEIANCEELKDPDTLTQAELCSAHLGCRLVFAIHKTCTKAKRFITNLKDAIGEGTKGLLGTRKEITPDAIFEASLTEKTRVLDTLPESRDMAAAIREKLRGKSGETLTGTSSDGSNWVYYGEVQDGSAQGVGTRIFSSGAIARGNFKNELHGQGESVVVGRGRHVAEHFYGNRDGEGAWAGESGARFVGKFENSNMKDGKLLDYDGTRTEGRFKENKLVEGKIYRPNGSQEEGLFDNGKLSVGKAYDAKGVATVVNIPREREIAAAATREAEERTNRLAEAERQAAEKRRLAEEARAAKAYRDSLNTMNPGQLFAKADELTSQGDQTRAREVLRTLISRFPNHALASTAAEQMAAASAAESSSPQATRQQNQSVAATPARSAGNCGSVMRQFQRDMQNDIEATPQINAEGLGSPRVSSHMVYLQQLWLSLANRHPACVNDQKWKRETAEELERKQSRCRSLSGSVDCTKGEPMNSGDTLAQTLQALLTGGSAQSGKADCAHDETAMTAEFERRNKRISSNDNVGRLALVRAVSLRLRDLWLPCNSAKARAYEKTATDTLRTCEQIASNSAACIVHW